MIPAAFDYQRAESAAEAVSLVAEHGEDAKFLAGGMSLLPLMKLRLATPTVLVDIGRIDDLSYVREDGDVVRVGALTSHRDVEMSLYCANIVVCSPRVAHEVGDPQVRHRGTLGGSIAHGDPAADLPAVLVALDTTVVATGSDGAREMAAADFFRGFLETALRPDELLTEIVLPKTGSNGFNFQKFNRRAQDFAIVGALAATVGGGVRVALVNMGSTPVRARGVEEALAQGASVDDAAARAAEGTAATEDLNASVEYREHLARVLSRRAIEAAQG